MARGITGRDRQTGSVSVWREKWDERSLFENVCKSKRSAVYFVFSDRHWFSIRFFSLFLTHNFSVSKERQINDERKRKILCYFY